MNHHRVPKWRYGDVLTNDESPNVAVDHTIKAMFLGWKYTTNYNATESIANLLILANPNDPEAPGTRIESYCGWWVDDE